MLAQLMTKSQSLLHNVFYFNFIFITVKITLLIKIFINNLNVFFQIQKHAFHSYNKTAFTVTVFTNKSFYVVCNIFSPFRILPLYESLSQHQVG